MTSPRYRCVFCGSFSGNAKEVRDHMGKSHRRALEWMLSPVTHPWDLVDPEEI